MASPVLDADRINEEIAGVERILLLSLNGRPRGCFTDPCMVVVRMAGPSGSSSIGTMECDGNGLNDVIQFFIQSRSFVLPGRHFLLSKKK
jgi:hypothetical protein